MTRRPARIARNATRVLSLLGITGAAAGGGRLQGVAALEAIGGDPTRWDLAAWNTNMAWAFRTNLPTPNLDRRLLFPLALTSPIYTLRDLWTLFQELKAYDARRLPSRLAVPFFLFQSERDVITLTSLATEYFQEVQAPTEQLALIPDAATSPPSPNRSGSWPSCWPGCAPWPPRPLNRYGQRPQASRSAGQLAAF